MGPVCALAVPILFSALILLTVGILVAELLHFACGIGGPRDCIYSAELFVTGRTKPSNVPQRPIELFSLSQAVQHDLEADGYVLNPPPKYEAVQHGGN